MSEQVRHRTGAELIHEFWQKQAKKQIEEMKDKKMPFAKPKMKVRMRRKAWRPLNLGVKIYTVLRTPRISVMRKCVKEVLNE